MGWDMPGCLKRFGSTVTIAVTLWAGGPAAAEMIILSGGRVRVGRITSEDSKAIRLRTGSTSGVREVTIPRGRIRQILRGTEEADHIRSGRDLPSLRRWVEGYFHAGLEDSATRCLQRALDLDPSVGRRPKKKGAEGFLLFWNRTVLRRRADQLTQGGPAGLLEVAKWAHEAGLAGEAQGYLRRAWQADRESAEIPAWASKWGISLDPWIRLDLTAALDGALFARAIQDEGSTVAAREGLVFLTLPLRYDPTAGPQTLSKSSFRGREIRGFYGLRSLRVRGDDPRLEEFSEQEPVFERLELKGGPADQGRERPKNRDRDGDSVETAGSRRPELLGKNILGPRRVEGEETRRDRPKLRNQTLRPTGWAALVLELPETAAGLSFEWVDGIKEELDLVFLRHVRDPLSGLVPGASTPSDAGDATSAPDRSMPPAVSAIVRRLAGRSPAMVALSIRRLGRLQEEALRYRQSSLGVASVKAGPAWAARIDAAVVVAGTRQERAIQAAAWSYFASRPSVAVEVVELLGEQKVPGQHAWIALIESNALGARPADLSTATGLLGGILRSKDASVCDAALDVLMRLDAAAGETNQELDWTFAEQVSRKAQSRVLARLDLIADASSARRLLRVLMNDVRPATAEIIAGLARRLGIGVSSPDDPLLDQWDYTVEAAEQEGVLKVLAAVSLGDLVYSRRFAEIIEEATDDEADEVVRGAAFELVIKQGRRRIAQPAAPGGRSESSGGFPVLLSINSRNPLVDGLASAARRGSRPVRVRALAALVLMGYAETAAKCLVEGSKNDAERQALIEKLVTFDEEVAGCDGLPAMLGHLLCKTHLPSAKFILSHLSHLWANAPASARWRLLAAVKSGVDFEKLSGLGAALKPPVAGKVARWLHALGHMTAQDRQRLATSEDAERHLRRLERINSRRGYIVDGRYGALAIVETVVAQGWPAPDGYGEAGEPSYRWGAPRRVTVALGPLSLETSEEDDSYEARWAQQALGRGLARNYQHILRPSRYSPRLEEADQSFLGIDGWGWPDPGNPGNLLQAAVGPAVLNDRPALANPVPGTMTLELGQYLRAGLLQQWTFGDQDIEGLVPQTLRVTLRYAAFGSFYGVGQRRPLPRGQVPAGQRHLLNVMIVLERLE
jgi:hypothetical protein